MIRVCKQVEISGVSQICFGMREFKTCEPTKFKRTIDICHDADTYELARDGLPEVIKEKCDGYTCVVGNSQSASDIGPTFWQWLGGLFLSCNPGDAF